MTNRNTFYSVRLAGAVAYWAERSEEYEPIASVVASYNMDDILGIFEVEKSGQALMDFSHVNVTEEAAKAIWGGLDDMSRESPPKFVQRFYPDWQDEYEADEIEAEENAAHIAEMSHPSRYL